MVASTMLTTCSTSCKVNQVRNQVNELSMDLESKRPALVQGEDHNGTFYSVDGQKAYLTIQGRPVEQYLAQPVIQGERKNNF